MPLGGHRQLGLPLRLKADLSKRLNPRPASWQMTDFAAGRVPPEEELTSRTISDPFESQVQMQSSEEGRRRQYRHFKLGVATPLDTDTFMKAHKCSCGQVLDLCYSNVSRATTQELEAVSEY